MRISPLDALRGPTARLRGSVLPAALAVLTALAAAPVWGGAAQTVSVSTATGPLRTVDGCLGNRIAAPLVPIWDRNPSDDGPARRIGYLRGTHRRSLCDGTVVRVHERVRRNGHVHVLVEPVVGPGPGWISEGFLGSYFPRWRCAWRFEGEELERCREL